VDDPYNLAYEEELDELAKKREDKAIKRKLSELGSGIFQLLSILIDIELAIIDGGYKADSENPTKSNSTILIEEPEICLHPNFQSKLAEVIVDAHNKFGINFIIETHSEYLVRSLQYLVAKRSISNKKIAIHYFKNNNTVLEIKTEENGNLSDPFPEGFYDESLKLQFELLNLKNLQQN